MRDGADTLPRRARDRTVARSVRGDRPHRPEQRIDRPQHARHAAERERGGAEAGHLKIARRAVAADPVDGIGDVGATVELPVEAVERMPRLRRKAAERGAAPPARHGAGQAMTSAPGAASFE